jgi:hypothetical protein
MLSKLLKTENRLIAEFPTNDYYYFKQFHSRTRELLHPWTWTASPGKAACRAPLFLN